MAATSVASTEPRVAVRQRSKAEILRDFGPFALGVYMLATARWGSYLLPGPPYIGDLAVMLLLAERGLAVARGFPALSRVEPTVALLCGCLLAWSALRFVYGSLSANALRDVAPYGYAVLVFLAPSRRLSDLDRRNMERILVAGLVFHSVWVTVDVLSPTFSFSLPALGGGQSRFFELRPDVDQTTCAVLALIGLSRAIAGRQPSLNLFVVAWNTALVFDGHSRAALAAAAVEFVVFALFTPASRQLVRRYSVRVILAAAIVGVAGVAYGLSRGAAGTRLGSATSAYLPFVPTSGPVPEQTDGTARARQLAWQAVERYLAANSSRNWFGVGFGPDFLLESGGQQALLGGTSFDVRQPHNFLINTWARLGVIGLAIVLAILAVGVRMAAIVGRSGSLNDVDLAAALVVTGFPVAALYGVVLESPFGAIPYFWALGYLGWRSLEVRPRRLARRT
jgi:O-antigen ligase